MAEKVGKLVDKVNVNLATFSKQQEVERLERTRLLKNMVLIKSVLSNDGVMKVLTPQGVKDVAAIDVEEVEYEEKEKPNKTKPKQELNALDDSDEDKDVPKEKKKGVKTNVDAPSSSSAQQKVTKVAKVPLPILPPQSVSTPKSDNVKTQAMSNITKEKLKVMAKQKVKETKQLYEEPKLKVAKRSLQFDDSDDETNDADVDMEASKVSVDDQFGDPQPDGNVVHPQSNQNGRRVYGITGSNSAIVKGGCFLLYDVLNIYQFKESVIKAAKIDAMRAGEVMHMAQLASKESALVESAEAFMKSLLQSEAKGCKRPTFLERPIVSMHEMELKSLFNELPEPLRSGLHKFCKEVNLFKKMDHKKLALMLDEVVQLISADVRDLRQNLPEVTVDFESFQHTTFVAP